ncbi:MAG: hemolysin III family protein [Bacteroidota bacterium]|nr:hemolysin III family protein [Bacteroidota bacterium]
MKRDLYEKTVGEEIANTITHGIGLLFSITALVLLVVFAATKGTAWHVVSFSIYGTTMILVYASSTLFHAIQNYKVKKLFNLFDHSAIFLLIAGTYTPITLVTLRGTLGWTIFGVIWGLAILGIVMKVFFIGRHRILSTFMFIAMACIIVVAINPLIENMAMQGLWLLLAGGLSYISGVIFYLWKKLPYAHSVWHLFVMGGTICHFFAIILYVV